MDWKSVQYNWNKLKPISREKLQTLIVTFNKLKKMASEIVCIHPEIVKMNFKKYLIKITIWNACFQSLRLQENLFISIGYIFCLFFFFIYLQHCLGLYFRDESGNKENIIHQSYFLIYNLTFPGLWISFSLSYTYVKNNENSTTGTSLHVFVFLNLNGSHFSFPIK